MADITSTYQLPNYYPASNLFTSREAEGCVIVYTKKINYNSVFNHWEIQVRDDLSNTYTWKDFRTAEAASKSTIKFAIKTHLTENVIKVKEDGDNSGYLITSTSPSDRGQDEYVG